MWETAFEVDGFPSFCLHHSLIFYFVAGSVAINIVYLDEAEFMVDRHSIEEEEAVYLLDLDTPWMVCIFVLTCHCTLLRRYFCWLFLEAALCS